MKMQPQIGGSPNWESTSIDANCLVQSLGPSCDKTTKSENQVQETAARIPNFDSVEQEEEGAERIGRAGAAASGPSHAGAPTDVGYKSILR